MAVFAHVTALIGTTPGVAIANGQALRLERVPALVNIEAIAFVLPGGPAGMKDRSLDRIVFAGHPPLPILEHFESEVLGPVMAAMRSEPDDRFRSQT